MASMKLLSLCCDLFQFIVFFRSFFTFIDTRKAPGVFVSATASHLFKQKMLARQAEKVPLNLNRIMPA